MVDDRGDPTSAARRRRFVGVLVLTYQLVAVGYVSAAAGDRDVSFSGDGEVPVHPLAESAAGDVVAQPNGKILVAGMHAGDFILTRFNPNGTPDTSFSGDGVLTIDFPQETVQSWRVALTRQSDGKILVAGSDDSDFIVARVNPNGTLDSTFSLDGRVTIDFGPAYTYFASDIAVQPDGKIVVVGSSQCCAVAARLNSSNGSLDVSFGSGGKVTTIPSPSTPVATLSALQVAVHSDGKIVIAGEILGDGWDQGNSWLVRLTTKGILDSTFGDQGERILASRGYSSPPSGLIVQADGKILVATAGIQEDSGRVVRLSSIGNPDSAFGDGGYADVGDFFIWSGAQTGLAVQADGKIVVIGTVFSNQDDAYLFGIGRLNGNGSPDGGFGGQDGVVTYPTNPSCSNSYAPMHAVALQPADGRIVIAAARDSSATCSGFSSALLRFHAFSCNGRDVTRIGTSASDVILGTDGPDVVLGFPGNDTISGLGGNDVICGSTGNDKLDGGSGNDTLLGEKGDDALIGGLGTDACNGGPHVSRDTIISGCEGISGVP